MIIPNTFCFKRNLNLDSEIIIKIKGTGAQYILNEYFYKINKPDGI